MKRFLVFSIFIVSLILAPFQHGFIHAYDTQFDEASKSHIATIFSILENNASASDEKKLDLISEHFKGVPYVANRLVGDAQTPEQLVLALNELDCFTYVDYIEAFKRSTNVDEFITQLKKVRYIDGKVTYLNRKHFFSDWFAENDVLVKDVLTEPQYANVIKSEVVDINKGKNGEYIKGLPDRQRTINYIPREKITPELLKTFQTGDYVGLRTNIAGLDVTHCGIIIQKEDGTYMRHASSQKAYKQVIDQKLDDYFAAFSRPTGILVFRSNAKFAVKTVPVLKDNNVSVTGKLANTMSLSVTKLDEQISALKNDTYDLYDITLKGANTPITGEFTVNAPYSNTVKAVYHIKENGELENINYTQNETNIVFSTTHFSKYAIVYDIAQHTETTTMTQTTTTQQPTTTATTKKNTTKELPKTSDSSHIYMMSGIVVLLLSVAIYQYKKQNQ